MKCHAREHFNCIAGCDFSVCHQDGTKTGSTDFSTIYVLGRSRESVVGIATGYGLDDRGIGVRVLVGSRFFFTPCRPDWLWGPPNLLSNRYPGLFPRV
jgi:hypothetical protein